MKTRLLGLALLITACSPATKASQPNPQTATTVKIENDNVQDMDVFVLSNGLRMRLGLVSGGHTEVFTLPVGLGQLIVADVQPWGELMAASLLTALPVIVFYMLGQKFMIAGLTAGSVKG